MHKFSSQDFLRYSPLSRLTERYGVSLPTLYRLGRLDKRFPKAHVLPTGTRLWSIAELDAYFDGLNSDEAV
jgi:predicted DNA-binding transcriptional regulator AlpA